MNLEQLAVKHGSDKRGEIHDYARKYEQYFAPIRMQKLTILEIGVFGGSSLKMWRDYFPNATIVGVDINPDSKVYAENRVHIEIGDQSDPDFLFDIGKKYGSFDIIIDDGSHATKHHIATFEGIYHRIAPHAFYIIEDLHTSYWPAYMQGVSSVDELLKPIIDKLNWYGHNGYGNPDGKVAGNDLGEHGLLHGIGKTKHSDNVYEFIHFYKSIAFIKFR